MQEFALVIGDGLVVVAVHMKNGGIGWRYVGDGIGFLNELFVVLDRSSDEPRLRRVWSVMIDFSRKVVHSQKVCRAEPITDCLHFRGCLLGNGMRIEGGIIAGDV